MSNSPSTDPGIPAALAGEDFADDDAVRAVTAGMEKAHATLQQFTKAEKAAKGDPTLTDAARAVELHKLASKRSEGVHRALDTALSKVRSEIDREYNAISESLRVRPNEHNRPDEMRARLAAMNKKDRREVLNQALQAGDAATVGAVVNASPWLSGVTAEEVDQLRTRWALEQHPDRLRRLELLEKLDNATQTAGGAFMKRVSEIRGRAKGAASAAEARRQAFAEPSE